MQKFGHRSLIYGTIETQERVLVRQGIRAIRVRAIEVLLYLPSSMFAFHAGIKNCVSRYFGLKDTIPDTVNNKIQVASVCGMKTGLEISLMNVFKKSENERYEMINTELRRSRYFLFGFGILLR